MARELHKKKGKELYAIYSTVVEDYITDFIPLEDIRKIWLEDLVEDAKRKLDVWLNNIDKEVE
ncbi:MAG TPA: hypothetical protein IAB58_01270 [Candidatus Pelethosoma merdigallinarum]|jgi:hypothetical protein|nr:hypothetical protein [Candidatus Pelethosoma merdigallinarum]